MDYFEGLDEKALDTLGWKLLSKQTKEVAAEPDKVTVVMAFQSNETHQCPGCGQNHYATIGFSDNIAKNATVEEARAVIDDGWSAAISLIITVNTRIERLGQFGAWLSKQAAPEDADGQNTG